MHRLIVDAGNTSIKLGVFLNDKLTRVVNINTNTYSFTTLKKVLPIKNYQSVHVGSVVKELNTRLLHDLQRITKINVTLIKANDFQTSFGLSQFNTNEIGVDILGLALITKLCYQTGVAISFGTATFAVAVKRNTLIGVAIAPSIELGTRQLQTTTSLIKKVNTKIGNLSFGRNTTTALQSGGSHMARGFIISVLDYVRQHYRINHVLIAGGKTAYLKKIIKKIPHAKVLSHAVLLGYYQLIKTILA
ncbi:MAG: type III pantothenate kinase [Mycoplasmataceae bacterium]|jgi:pantothenate kinase type III|nr:type III pantothenate kinase [Mycoplasmataceae bacterium]